MELNEFIDEIRSVLSQAEGIDYAFLFGSALRRLLPDSDLDILVGGELDFDQKNRLAMKLALRLKRNVDIVLAKEASHELILKALSQGRPIVVHRRKSLREDYFRNYFLYDASTSLRNIRLERVKRVYGND
jgi:predicted nucleotidyltransferase